MHTPRFALCLLGAFAVIVTASVAVCGGGAKEKAGNAGAVAHQPAVPIDQPQAAKAGQRLSKRALVGELTAALDETRSVDTFLLAVSALAELGAEARPAVRAVLRNGERLGVLKDHAVQPVLSAERIRCAGQVHQAVVRILKGDGANYPAAYGYTPPGPFCGPPAYPIPAPAWNPPPPPPVPVRPSAPPAPACTLPPVS
jgi:hypothetical protein